MKNKKFYISGDSQAALIEKGFKMLLDNIPNKIDSQQFSYYYRKETKIWMGMKYELTLKDSVLQVFLTNSYQSYRLGSLYYHISWFNKFYEI